MGGSRLIVLYKVISLQDLENLRGWALGLTRVTSRRLLLCTGVELGHLLTFDWGMLSIVKVKTNQGMDSQTDPVI